MKVNQIKAGAILSYLNIASNIVTGLLVTPAIRFGLGKEEYALYMTIGAMIGYLSVLDFGLGNTITRFIAKYRAEGDERGQKNFLGVTFLIYAVISLLLVALGVVCYTKMHILFPNLDPGQLQRGREMFLVLVFNLGITLTLNSFPAIMTGYERFVLPRALVFGRIVIRTALVLVLMELGYKAIAIVLLDTALNLIFMCINMAYVFAVLKVRIRLYEFKMDFIKKIFNYSIFVFIAMLADQLYWRIGSFILTNQGQLSATADFTNGMQIVVYFMTFSTAIQSLFLPRATQMAVREASGEEMTDLMIRTGRIQLLMVGLILCGYLIFGYKFMILWLGWDAVPAYWLSMFVMLPLTIPLVQNVGVSILQAQNKHGFRAVLYLCIGLANTVLSYYCALTFGLLGAAIGTVVSLIVGNILIMNFYYSRKIGLNMKRFFRETFHGILPIMLIATAIGSAFLLVHKISALTLGWEIALFTLLYALLMWKWGINDYERELFGGMFRKVLRRKRAA